MSDTLIEIIMRQTDYTREKAIDKLNIYNNSLEDVIKDYLEVPAKKEDKRINVNQQIYKEIRYMMDNASMKYEKEKNEEKDKENDKEKTGC
tara:strand:+ start:628 stop:900 length:273 start_codon:yes stop_codon:yes gene_type:complete